MTAPKAIPDAGRAWQLRALMARHRYTGNLEAEVLQVLRGTHRQVAKELLASGLDRNSRQRLRALHNSLGGLLREGFAQAGELATRRLSDLAAVETRAASLVTGLGDLVPRNRLIETAALPLVVREIAVNGVEFGDWWTAGAAKALERVQREIQYGLVRSENPLAIARRIYTERDRKTGQAGGTVWKGSLASARMAVRTVATTIAAQTAIAGMRQTGVTRCRFEAVLDDRTSTLCASLDGTEYDLDDPALPIPALHPNCRSVLVPVVTWTKADGTLGKAGSSRIGYEAWLRAQSPEVQAKVLGARKAQLWRDGRVTLGDLLTLDRRPITLAQLEAALSPPTRNAMAFPALEPGDLRPVSEAAYLVPGEKRMATVDATRAVAAFRQAGIDVDAHVTAINPLVQAERDAIAAFTNDLLTLEDRQNAAYDSGNYGLVDDLGAKNNTLRNKMLASRQALRKARQDMAAKGRAILMRPDYDPGAPRTPETLHLDVEMLTEGVEIPEKAARGVKPLVFQGLAGVYANAERAWAALVNPTAIPRPAVAFGQSIAPRAGATPVGARTYIGLAVTNTEAEAIHELGHALERILPESLRADLRVWRNAQTNGIVKPLGELLGTPGAYPGEVALTPLFDILHPYVLRDYGDDETEVLSMGLEALFADPVWFAARFPTHFTLIMRLIGRWP